MIPAFANAHSHAFHRALRGRAWSGETFWGWREAMYAVAEVLDPELHHRLARAVYREMRLAGYDAVGEFHYLRHAPGGARYADPLAMAEAIIEAAREAGLRICVLDACYLRAGFEGEDPAPAQLRFLHPDADSWAQDVRALAARHAADPGVIVGAAIHSVRAVGPDDLPVVVAALPGAPLHVHVSEQPAENDACRAATGRTPVRLLAEAGAWAPHTTAVHATHLTDEDIALLGAGGGYACFCPTTEAELGDGIGPSVALREAGVRLTLGSDSHTVIDPFVEARALAWHERLATGNRHGWDTAGLVRAGAVDGHASLGFAPDRMLEITPSVRTAGAADPLWAATSADVRPPEDLDPVAVAHELATVIDEVWGLL